MHFYSEAPITSFFPPISKKRKKTELARPGSSNTQQTQQTQQTDHTSTTSRQDTKPRANEDEQECRNALDNGIMFILHSPSVDDLSTTRVAKSTRQQISASERHMSLLRSIDAKAVTPQTPNPDRPPSRKKRKISLQTPTPTNEAVRLMELTPTLSPFIFRKSLYLRIEGVPLPTPSPLKRSPSHHNGHSGNERCQVVQEQVLLSPTRSKRLDTSLKASVPAFIPSSPSQLMANTYSEDKHHLMSASTALPYRQLPQHEVQPSPSNRIMLYQRDKRESTSPYGQMFISSSQSQLLSPLDHPQHSLIVSNPELDIIPSSQSQETELRLCDAEECHQSIHSRNLGKGLSSNLKHLADLQLQTWLIGNKLCHNEHSQMNCFNFSAATLQMAWTDCSLDPEQPAQCTADVPCVANVHGDDSATESESEPEMEEKNSHYRNLTPIRPQSYGFSQPAADIPSLSEDSEHKNSHNSQQSSQELSLAARTSSFASLPSAVKEFQSMFGSDDESYPLDFPMSLR